MSGLCVPGHNCMFHRFRRAGRAMWALLLVALLLWTALPGQAQDKPVIVSRVNQEPISQATFQARVRFVRWQYLREITKLYELTGGSLGVAREYALGRITDLQDSLTLGKSVLGQMEEEILLWQTGSELGVTPAAEDVDARKAEFFSLWTDVPVETLPTDETAQAFMTDWYAEAMAVSGLSRDEIDHVFATEALRGMLLDYLGASLPTEELAVHSRHILCAFFPDDPNNAASPTAEDRLTAQACIEQAQARLDGGEVFANVAAALSNDSYSAAQGGDLGWVKLSYFVEPYADAAREAELNTVIGPVETPFGLHLIEVLEREMQPMSEEDQAANLQGYYTLWLETLVADAEIERSEEWAVAVPDEPGLSTLPADVLAAVADLQEAPGAAESTGAAGAQ